MNEEFGDKNTNEKMPIDTELQVRLMNMVLGEASDFERDQLQLLMEQRPELAAYHEHLTHMHGLLCDVGTGEWTTDTASAPKTASDEAWRLPEQPRSKLLAILSSDPANNEPARSEANNLKVSLLSPVASVKKSSTRSRWFALAFTVTVAASVMIALLLPAVQSARVATRRSIAYDTALPSAYYLADDVQYGVDNSNSMAVRVQSAPQSAPQSIAQSSKTTMDDYKGPTGTGFGPADTDLDGLASSTWIDLQNRVEISAGQDAALSFGSGLADGEKNPKGLPGADGRASIGLGKDLEIPKSEAGQSATDYRTNPQSSAEGSVVVEVPKISGPENAYSVMAPNEYTDQSIQLGGLARGRQSGAVEERFGLQPQGDENQPLLLTPKLNIPEEEDEVVTQGQKQTVDAPYDQYSIDAKKRSPLDASDWERLAENKDRLDVLGIVPSDTASPEQSVASGEVTREQVEDLSKSERRREYWGKESAGSKSDQEFSMLRKKMDEPRDEAPVKGKPIQPGLDQPASNGRYDQSERGWRYIPAPSPQALAAPQEIASELEGKPTDLTLWDIRPAAKPAARPAQALDEQSAAKEAFSTFSLHVSDVSFKLAQTVLAQGQWPDATKIRIEEFVNAMDYHDPLPATTEKVACRVEQAIHPFLMQRNLLRISMRTAATGRSQNTPLRLTMLLDNSGSMERPDRRQAVLRAFEALIAQLKPTDQITLISFASQPRLLADKVPGSQGQALLSLIENLPSEGGTNIEAALKLASEKAAEQKVVGAENRIVLFTDGAVNLGNANPDSLAKIVTQLRDAGIAFDAAGISAQDLNDEVLEALTRQGDGRYYLLDSAEAVSEGFATQIAGALRPSAQNVKVQVEFNPERVGRYKLLGFEKHRLNKEDFRNDKVDAAELAAAEAGVAVYQFEIKPNGRGDVGSVSVRFRDLTSGQMVERRWPIPYESNTPRLEQAPASMQLASIAALFAAKLSGGPLADSVDLAQLQKQIVSLPDQFSRQPRVEQLKAMLEQAKQVSKE